MTLRAAPSPAWLGLFAVLSFGGLVLASFASGYHLVMKTAPRSTPAAPAGSPAANSPESSGTALAQSGNGAPSGSAAPSGGAAPAAANAASPPDPAEAIVRQNLRPDHARVRSQPDSGTIVGRLPSNQRVALLGRDGQWLHIQFDRKGKHIDGWTQESNLLLR